MPQNDHDQGKHVIFVVKKTVCNREDLIDDMREPWGWENLDLHGASQPPEMQYLRKWTTRAKKIVKYAFDKLGLAAGRHSDDYKRLLAATEWDYISHYLEGIKKSSGHGQLYELPSQLPFIGNTVDEFTGVERYSTLMIRIRLFHICHLVLQAPNNILPTIGTHGSPRAIIERYVQVEAGSDIALITESVFTAIKRMHHRLGIQDQRRLEKEMADLETVFEEASDKDRSFLRFEEIIRGNEEYAAFLTHLHADSRNHHTLQRIHRPPPQPVPYLPILGEILDRHAQHLAEEVFNPPATIQRSLARNIPPHLSYRQLVIYDTI